MTENPNVLPKIYRVEMAGLAMMRGGITVSADSEEDAGRQAKDRSGDVKWDYYGMDDDTIDIVSVEQISINLDDRRQVNLRNAVRRALREITETNSSQIDWMLVCEARKLRGLLRKAARPWSKDLLKHAEEVLHQVSASMGDHSLWNVGGQGYQAATLLNKRST